MDEMSERTKREIEEGRRVLRYEKLFNSSNHFVFVTHPPGQRGVKIVTPSGKQVDLFEPENVFPSEALMTQIMLVME